VYRVIARHDSSKTLPLRDPSSSVVYAPITKTKKRATIGKSANSSKSTTRRHGNRSVTSMVENGNNEVSSMRTTEAVSSFKLADESIKKDGAPYLASDIKRRLVSGDEHQGRKQEASSAIKMNANIQKAYDPQQQDEVSSTSTRNRLASTEKQSSEDDKGHFGSVATALFKQEKVDEQVNDDTLMTSGGPKTQRSRVTANDKEEDIGSLVDDEEDDDNSTEVIDTVGKRRTTVSFAQDLVINSRQSHRVSMALSRSRKNDGDDSDESSGTVDVGAELQKEALLALLHERALEEARLHKIIEQQDQDIEKLKRQAAGVESGIVNKNGDAVSQNVLRNTQDANSSVAGVLAASSLLVQKNEDTSGDEEKKKEQIQAAVTKDEDPRLKKYRKMLAMHVPRGAVEIKMRSEGLDPALLDSSNKDDSKEQNDVKSDIVEVSKDARFIKFWKMLSFHIPRAAIDVKMRAEGLNPAILDLDPTKPLPPSFQIEISGGTSIGRKKLDLPKKKNTKEEEEHYIKLRGLYWHRIKLAEIGGTIWEKINATKYDLMNHDSQREAIRKLVDHASGLSAKARSNVFDPKKNFVTDHNTNNVPAPQKPKTIADVQAEEESKDAQRRRRHSSWHVSSIVSKDEELSESTTALRKESSNESTNPILNAIQERRRCSTTAAATISRDENSSVQQETSSSTISSSSKKESVAVHEQKRSTTLSAKLRNYARLLGTIRCKMSAISFFERRIHEVAPHKVVVLAKDLVVDMQALEDFFCDVTANNSNLHRLSGGGKKTPKIPSEIRILDPKRAQSVQITLGSIKVGSFGEIRDAIIAIDANKLPHLSNAAGTEVLLSICPTQEEYGKVRAYVDDGKDVSKLAPAERFFAIIGEIPRLTPRLTCVLELLRFDETLNHILEQADAVELAGLRLEKMLGTDLEAITQSTATDTLSEGKKLKEIDISSAPLAAFLCVILAAGNRMNQGSKGRGDAAGFQLEILTKLTNIKCNDPKAGTFLTFVVDQIGLDRTSKLIGELSSPIQRASRVNYDSVEREFDQLEKIIETRVFRELQHGTGTLEDDTYRRPFLNFCGKFASHATRRLESARIVVARARSLVERVARFLKVDLYDTSAFAENCDGVQQFFGTLKLFLVQVEAAIVFNAKRRKAEEEERKRERQRALVKARERAAAEERKRKAEIEAAAAARAHEKEILAASANSDQSQDDIQVDDTPPMYECAQCAIANSNMIAGAFSIADGT